MYNLTRKTNINNNKNAKAIKYKNNKQKGTKKLMKNDKKARMKKPTKN